MTAYHADASLRGDADDSSLEDREVLTWERFGTAARELAAQVVADGFTPSIVISVARGGLVLGGAMTYALGVKLADAINVEFYTDVHETLSDPVLLSPMLDTEFIVGRRVLVVDDVVDTGRTARIVREMVPRAHFATIYAKPAGREQVDTFITEVSQDTWILFPWDAESRFVQPLAAGR